MRPGDFSPGNQEHESHGRNHADEASMRPGDFSPGNGCSPARGLQEIRGASMRPGDFSPGNSSPLLELMSSLVNRFNEAGGFLPRKQP